MKGTIGLLTLPFVLLFSAVAAAQTAPPIQGVTGTIATDGSIEGVHKAAGAAARGVKKILPAGKSDADNPLDVLIAGSRVVLRDMADGGEAVAATTEGVVIDVNRSRKQITIRTADRKAQTLRVMDASAPAGAHVVVSLADQSGAKTYDFKRVS